VLAIWLAFTINFLLQSCIAILCFWSERASALERLLFIPYLFLSGLVAPLEVFPPELRAAAHWTPFPLMVAFPAQLLAGGPVTIGASFAAAPRRGRRQRAFSSRAMFYRLGDR